MTKSGGCNRKNYTHRYDKILLSRRGGHDVTLAVTRILVEHSYYQNFIKSLLKNSDKRSGKIQARGHMVKLSYRQSLP